MANQVTLYAAAGSDDASWALVASDGYPAGTSGTVAVGSVTGFTDIVGLQNAGFAIAEAPRVDVPGDDRLIASFLFSQTEPPTGTLVTGARQMTLEAAGQGSRVYDINSRWSMGLLQIGSPTYPSLWLILNTQAKSQDSGSVGSAGFEVTIAKVQLVPRGRDSIANQEAAAYNHDVLLSAFDVSPWGYSLTNANNGTTQAYVASWYSENRMTMDTIVRETGTTTFDLTKEAAADNGNAVHLWDFTAGTPMTYNAAPSGADQWSVSTSGGTSTITLGAAGTEGNVIVALYEYV